MRICRDNVPLTVCLFEERWEEYDLWYEHHREIAESEVMAVRASVQYAPRPVAEIGVGTGFFAYRLGMDLGLDPAYNMLKMARMRGVEVIQAVGEQPPLRRGSLGTAVIIVTLCFAPDPLGLVRGTAEALRPGGKVVSCIIPRDSSWGQRYLELARQGDPFYSVARFYTVEEVAEMYRTIGLEPTGCWSTISYTPDEPPRLEKPWRECKGGFVCIEGLKTRL